MSKKALLINDSHFESLILKDILKKNDVIVEIGNEFEVYDLLESFEPDYLFVNLIMEEVRGDKLIDDVKQSYIDIKCVLTSSNKLNIKDYESIDAILSIPVSKFSVKNLLLELEKPEEVHEEIETEKEIRENYEEKKEVKEVENKETKFKFCPFCGENLEKLSNNAFKFCPYCGEGL